MRMLCTSVRLASIAAVYVRERRPPARLLRRAGAEPADGEQGSSYRTAGRPCERRARRVLCAP
jgi:hypothetical protein